MPLGTAPEGLRIDEGQQSRIVACAGNAVEQQSRVGACVGDAGRMSGSRKMWNHERNECESQWNQFQS
jgi:hypothetical protein